MPRLTRQAIIIGIGRLMNMAAASATLMVMARILPDRESYGAICQLIVMYMVLSQIFSVGLPQSIYYFFPRYAGGERRGFITQTVALLTLSGLLMSLAFYCGAAVIADVLNSPLLTPLLHIFALYPIFMMPTLAVEGSLLQQNRAVATVIFSAVLRVGMLCAMVIPAWMGAPLTTVVAIWMAMAGVMWIVALTLIFSTVRGLPFAWRREMLREELGFSLPLGLGSLLTIAGLYLDRFLVSHNYGAAAFGAYTNASVAIPTVTMITSANAVVLTNALSRVTSTGDEHLMMPIWNNAMCKSGIALFATLGFLAFWAPETMSLLFSHRFADSGTLLGIYIWIIPAQLLVLQPLFVALGMNSPLLMIPFVSLIIEVVCVFGLGHWFGLYGFAAGAVLARYLGVQFGAYWFLRHQTHLTWRGFLPWGKLACALGLALLAGAGSHLLQRLPVLSHHPIVAYVAGVLLFVALYSLGLHVTRLLGFLVPAGLLPGKRASEVAA